MERPEKINDAYGNTFKQFESEPIFFVGDCKLRKTDNGWQVAEIRVKRSNR
jgi:hypothetical protein